MSDSGRSLNVLQKLLNSGKKEEIQSEKGVELIEKFLQPKPSAVTKIKKKAPGRPRVKDENKARNFTLCLAPKYLQFLDAMEVRDPKIKGRGRKIRFIIDQFIDLHKRQKNQLLILKEALIQVERTLKELSANVKAGEKLELSNLEKKRVTEVVKQVRILLNVLCYTPKDLHRLLPKGQWAIVSFCLNWSKGDAL